MRRKQQQILFVAAIFALCRSASAQGQGIDFAKIEILSEKTRPEPLYALRLSRSRPRP
jgi:hypothetical protein